MRKLYDYDHCLKLILYIWCKYIKTDVGQSGIKKSKDKFSNTRENYEFIGCRFNNILHKTSINNKRKFRSWVRLVGLYSINIIARI